MTDADQQKIVGMHGRTALLLAGPGCGKTHILAKRIFDAHTAKGVEFSDMLCLTFTNRAAREMDSRISSYLGYRPKDLFVGNIHSFCIRFLLANRLLHPDTGILDEEDQDEYLSSALGIIRAADRRDFRRIACFLFQMDEGHPEALHRRPPRPVTRADMEAVRTYCDFKERNSLVDYDEIILRAYSALMRSDSRYLAMGHYSWAQVDEVQDMTALQLAIVERLTAGHDRTVLYLGDEQQAIFSFTGAGGVALDALKNDCGRNILRLKRNYRSPDYLVSTCNELAAAWLGIAPALLPRATSGCITPSDALVSVRTTADIHTRAICAYARRLLASNPGEDVAILTRTNAEADAMAESLRAHRLEHMHLSRKDIFHCVAFKTVYSHLRAIASPISSAPWINLLYRTGAVRTIAEARTLAGQMQDTALEPRALLYPDTPSAVERFVKAMTCDGEIVIFDTETTGLDCDNDDIVQISAVKLRAGKTVDDGGFEIFVGGTDRSIPPTLAGGTPNPLFTLYKKSALIEATEAFTRFFTYVGDAVAVAGHNIEFDLRMLRANLRRRTNLDIPEWLASDAQDNCVIDTLTIARLLMPRLRNHSLASLIDRLGLNGTNSHNATDDVAATASLALFMLNPARIKAAGIRNLRAEAAVQHASSRLVNRYGEFYRQERALYLSDEKSTGSLAEAFSRTHEFFVRNAYIETIPRLDYLLKLIDIIVSGDEDSGFRRQSEWHLHELLTYNESDLFTKRIVDERLSVMTVHKAKGLEMDNVIIYDIAAGWGPTVDRARVFYVAFSRARRRLALFCQGQADVIAASVLPRFSEMPSRQLRALLAIESAYGD